MPLAFVSAAEKETSIEMVNMNLKICEYESETTLERLYRKAPVMKKIAKCESGDRQFNENGSVLMGKWSPDKGRFQINKVHWQEARSLGINLDSVEGNAEFAEILYKRNGTRDWYMSQHCWA